MINSASQSEIDAIALPNTGVKASSRTFGVLYASGDYDQICQWIFEALPVIPGPMRHFAVLGGENRDAAVWIEPTFKNKEGDPDKEWTAIQWGRNTFNKKFPNLKEAIRFLIIW